MSDQNDGLIISKCLMMRQDKQYHPSENNDSIWDGGGPGGSGGDRCCLLMAAYCHTIIQFNGYRDTLTIIYSGRCGYRKK